MKNDFINEAKKALMRRDWKKLGFLSLKIAAFLFLGGFLAMLLLFVYYTYDLPRPEKFTEARLVQSTKIYDRTGKTLLYDIYGEEKREIISFDKISQYLKDAVIASEDERFYQHGGIDIRGIARAILTDLQLMSKEQGASTITQQLIRTVYLTNQKSIARKVREVVLSIELEEKYSKDQIFDWYLNTVPFGENAYGIEAASQTYFNKPALDLTVAEAATLTALLPAPSHYSPYGPYKSELLQKKNNLLDKMQKLGFINENQLKEAKEEKINFAEESKNIKAPDFVLYVKKYLDEKYGEDYLKEKGLKVYTSLDYELQEYAEQVVKENSEANAAKKSYNSAIVVLDPKTGEILALMGSKDYFAKAYPEGCDEQGPGKCLFEPKFDVATIGKRQPGSSFKPFAYITALKKGYTPDTVIWDTTTEFNPNCDPGGNQNTDRYGLACYHPQNYDGLNRGPVRLKQALGSSLNIPSVKMLYLAGIPETLKTAKDFGMTTLTDVNNYGLSLVLGGGDVNLLEMSAAYGVFATDGYYTPPVSILKIEDSDGNIIEQNQVIPRKVLDTQVARQMNSILSDNNNRAPVFGYYSPLHLPGYDVAAKTGTTQSLKDGWTMGYTPNAVVGVWTGNNNNEPTNDTGVGVAAPMWNKIMQQIVESHPTENFTPPDPISGRSTALMGQLSPYDNNTILYYVDKNDPMGNPPQNPALDPQYPLWQIGINNWLISSGKFSEYNSAQNSQNNQEDQDNKEDTQDIPRSTPKDENTIPWPF